MLHMGNLDMFEIAEVISAQIEETRCKTASGCGKEAVLRVELGEVYFLTVAVRWRLPEEYTKLCIVLKWFNLLMILIVNSHVPIGVHSRRQHAHLRSQKPLLMMLLLLLEQLSLLARVSGCQRVHHLQLFVVLGCR